MQRVQPLSFRPFTLTQSRAQKLSRASVATLLLTIPLMLGWVSTANAASGTDEYIYSPRVVNGETELGFNAGYAKQDSHGHDFTLGHGFSDLWYSQVETGWEKQPHTGLEYQGLSWVNIFQVAEPGQHIVDFSVFTNMTFSDASNQPDTLQIGPMFEKELGVTVNNLNLTWTHDYGSHATHDTTFQYAWQTRIKGDPMLEYGFQAMGDLGQWSHMNSFGNQQHKIGPAFFGETRVGGGSDKVKYNGALLVGLTGATADMTLRFSVEYDLY